MHNAEWHIFAAEERNHCADVADDVVIGAILLGSMLTPVDVTPSGDFSERPANLMFHF